MEIKESVLKSQERFRGISGWIQALQIPQWAEYSVCFGLGLVLSAASVFGSPGPFGTAMLASLGFGADGFMCLLGATAGYYAGFGFQIGTQMVCGCMMVFVTSWFLRNHRLIQSGWYPVIVSSLAYGVTRLSLYWMTGGVSALILARMACFLLLCAASAILFEDVTRFREPRTMNAEICRNISAVYLIAAFLLGISRFLVFQSISVGRVLSLLILQIMSATGGPLYGSASGIVLGISMDIGAAQYALFAVMYPISSLASGLFSKHKRLYFSLSFILTYALTSFCLPAAALRVPALCEMAIASTLYLLLPQKLVISVGSFIQPQRLGRGESGLRKYLAGQIGSMSQAYRALFDVAAGAAQTVENDQDTTKVFDRSAERVCIACQTREICWGQNSGDTFHIMSEASVAMQQRGTLQESDFPERFRNRCGKLHEFVEVVNGELRLRAYRQRMHRQMREERAVLWDQYRDFSEVLGASARAMANVTGADPNAERRLIRYLRTIGVEADASVFRDDRGRLHAAIESRNLDPLLHLPGYLDGLSVVLGVRLCMPEHQAREDSILLLEAEPLCASVGIAAVRKRGESVSGDRGTYFKSDSGELFVILSDGMGSGRAAADCSIETIRILENFLRAGVAPSNALKLLNATALVRDTENWGYSTVDLISIDLFSGDACFYKYGAAPSYVRSGGVIRKIRSTSYAAGLSYEAGKSPDVMRMKLKPGSVAVIASDGIVSDGKDLWLRDLLRESDDKDMKALAGEVVKSAVKEYGRSDDMTALAIKVEVRT